MDTDERHLFRGEFGSTQDLRVGAYLDIRVFADVIKTGFGWVLTPVTSALMKYTQERRPRGHGGRDCGDVAVAQDAGRPRSWRRQE